MQIIIIRVQLPKCKSFSFAFSFRNASHSRSAFYPICPALMCKTDICANPMLHEAASVCANPTINYFYHPHPMCKSDFTFCWWETTNLCKSVRIRQVHPNGGQTVAGATSKPQAREIARVARSPVDMCVSDTNFS